MIVPEERFTAPVVVLPIQKLVLSPVSPARKLTVPPETFSVPVPPLSPTTFWEPLPGGGGTGRSAAYPDIVTFMAGINNADYSNGTGLAAMEASMDNI